jgi:hypothetical protein
MSEDVRIVLLFGGRTLRPLPKKPIPEADSGQQLGAVSRKCHDWTLSDVGGFSDRTLVTFGLAGAARPTPSLGEYQSVRDDSFT